MDTANQQIQVYMHLLKYGPDIMKNPTSLQMSLDLKFQNSLSNFCPSLGTKNIQNGIL